MPDAAQDDDQARRFECPWCGNPVSTFAGYIEMPPSRVEADKESKVSRHSAKVKICTKCGCHYVRHRGQTRDVTKLIELRAWADTQKNLRDTTQGQGGRG